LSLYQLSEASGRAVQGILVPDEADDALAALVRKQRARGERVIVDLSGGKSSAAEQQCNRIAVREDGAWIIEEA